jgi:hypothetical protein
MVEYRLPLGLIVAGSIPARDTEFKTTFLSPIGDPMKFSKTLRAAVSFAKFVKENDLDPHEAGLLVQAANLAFSANERECNTNVSAERQREQVNIQARKMGFETDWSGGLWPHLVGKDGIEVRIPTDL